jgi:hypothetical protein
MELGFINNSFMDNDEDGAWFFNNVKIYIKNAEDGLALLNDDTTTRNTIRYDVDKNREERCLVEYTDNVKPYERESFKKRYLFYKNQRKDLYMTIKNEVEDYILCVRSKKRKKKPHFSYEIINDFKKMIHGSIGKISSEEIIEIIFEKKLDEEMLINGWLNVRDRSKTANQSIFINNKCKEDSHRHGKRTEHVVVLTIPRMPADDGQIGIALTDYAAAGKVIPFTCCWCC